MTDDIRQMKRALALARRGIGKTSPNPAVGCVIVKDGVIVGTGWHRKAGTSHAEIHALEMAGESARGADVFVTLEPCCHTGKTPPCSQALIRAGVRRVVAGMSDPNPRVSGGGLAELETAGIQVVCGVLEKECRDLNRPFIKQVTTGMPHVTYKCAMTLDGKIATVSGASRWISCQESRTLVHRMRARMDAIMVGVDTIIADDPQLTVRHVRGRNPLRVVVDTRLRTPESVRVLGDGNAVNTLIATAETNPRVHLRYQNQGATILVCDQENGRVSMKDLMFKLGKRGVQSILLEGGGRLAGSMLEQGLIDEFVFFLAPKILGSDGFSPFSLVGRTSMEQASRLNIIKVSRSGIDIVVHARSEAPCSPA
ncbi:bifunctional diaminohydroxyphosphoribosylaminopyrimidine deaminase/5-amino-6-(5-phosphoribosylamino)uracil reductase RibD [Pelobacter propionicus]|uniref:Riboflavin biosynthesis protein RibD n=1 Tax=Pelobacter propionicus (strain DSM 2379 / NBRC 103807 / OttBd1) TaxID=338966 RepID=A1APE1_PELPD|nr:bifunctional diaminohydroxyphosphoribosylaminopyrimidine deaminase/5-amino-6-(5-phosphoribosylamino)uracil reductase RibD [Pelobacter propionicus]ABK99211.1 5-amino-6-(5-phosphoribosylamino)uracil reductase [Pelobacter propionicus DSM 2379]